MSAVGCSTGTEPGADFALDSSPEVKDDSAAKTLAFTVVDADLGTKAAQASRWLVTSKKGFEKTFATTAPKGVDWGKDWLYVYSAGTKSTGGYTASVQKITYRASSGVLRFYDQLESPGSDCFVTESLTTPYVAVKFKKQGYDELRYTHDNETTSCDPCATVRCAAGTTCEEQDGSAVCVPDASACAAMLCAPGTTCVDHHDGTAGCYAPKFCGGIAAFQCPGLGQCVDNPADSCDPANGGADCGGLCTCEALAKCAAGQTFNRDPNVCACEGVCVQTQACMMGATWDPVACKCKPATCVQNTLCMVDAHWDSTACKCVKN